MIGSMIVYVSTLHNKTLEISLCSITTSLFLVIFTRLSQVGVMIVDNVVEKASNKQMVGLCWMLRLSIEHPFQA